MHGTLKKSNIFITYISILEHVQLNHYNLIKHINLSIYSINYISIFYFIYTNGFLQLFNNYQKI